MTDPVDEHFDITAAQRYPVGLAHLTGVATNVEHFGRIYGDVDPERLRSAVLRVMDANLHMRLLIDLRADLHLAQRLDADVGSRVTVLYNCLVNSEAGTDELQREVDVIIAARRTAIEDGRPFVVRIVPIRPNVTILYWRADISVFDGLSHEQFPRAVMQAYETNPIADLEVDISTLSRHQHATINAADSAGFVAHDDFWSNKLALAPFCTQIPDPNGPLHLAAVAPWSDVDGTLSPSTTAFAQTTAWRYQYTLHTLLIAALAALVHLAGGLDDLIIVLNIPARTPKEMRRLGRYGDLAMLRLKITDACTFAEILAIVKRELNEVLTHRRYTHSEMVKKILAQTRDFDAIPIMSISYDGMSPWDGTQQQNTGLRYLEDSYLEGCVLSRLAIRRFGDGGASAAAGSGSRFRRTSRLAGPYCFTGFHMLTLPSKSKIDYRLTGPMSCDSLEIVANAWAGLLRSVCLNPEAPIVSHWPTGSAQRQMATALEALQSPDCVEFRGLFISPTRMRSAVCDGLGLSDVQIELNRPVQGDLAVRLPIGTAGASLQEIRSCIHERLSRYPLPIVTLAADGKVCERLYRPDECVLCDEDESIRAAQQQIERRVGLVIDSDDEFGAAVSLEPWFLANVADALADVTGRRPSALELKLTRSLRSLVQHLSRRISAG